MPILYSLKYSPWSERARWALDHHQIAYQTREYSPLFGVPGLRFRIRQWQKKLTVPILMTDQGCHLDSLEIATYAESNGASTSLFHKSHEDIAAWNSRSETALAAGRALLTYRVSQNREAMQDYLPRWLPKILGDTVGIATARIGIGYFRKKYGFQNPQPEVWLETLSRTLALLDESLKNRPYLLHDFSYADITMAMVLQFVKPVKAASILIPNRSLACWETPFLAQQFPHIIRWRDQLFRNHRPNER